MGITKYSIAFIKMNSFAGEYYRLFSRNSMDNDEEQTHLEQDELNIVNFAQSALEVFAEAEQPT